MSRTEPRDVAASIRQKLLNRSRELGEDFQGTLSDYARERFFARLQHSKHADSLILKGAALFRVWDQAPQRATRDTDFLAFGDSSEEAVASVVRDICRTPPPVDDGMVFDGASIRANAIRENTAHDGIRVRFGASLNNARVSMQIDFGFGDTVVPGPIEIEYPALLDFPPPRIRGYPRETVIAEKFQAMVALGEVNTRFKDFYDVWYISRRFDFDGSVLARAISATFHRRDTLVPASTPVALTDSTLR